MQGLCSELWGISQALKAVQEWMGTEQAERREKRWSGGEKRMTLKILNSNILSYFSVSSMLGLCGFDVVATSGWWILLICLLCVPVCLDPKLKRETFQWKLLWFWGPCRVTGLGCSNRHQTTALGINNSSLYSGTETSTDQYWYPGCYSSKSRDSIVQLSRSKWERIQ